MIQIVNGERLSIINMGSFSQEMYQKMFDLLLSEELCYEASAASEANIKNAMKRIFGRAIKTHVIKSYSGLVLDESLNVHFSIIDPTDG